MNGDDCDTCGYHELLDAMIMIKSILDKPTSWGNYSDDEIISHINSVVEELDI